MKFSILICAYNEEKNIGSLLSSILNELLKNESILCNLDKIVVVSDGSTDKTDEIVEKIARNNEKVFLITNEIRLGKALSFNKGKKAINSDYLISIDADVLLGPEVFSNVFLTIDLKNPDMITIHAKPKKGGDFNLSSLASMGTYCIMKNIIEISDKNSIFGARGVFVVLSKNFYEKFELVDAPGTDMFMFLLCMEGKYRYEHIRSSIIYYSSPKSFSDFLKQNHRASAAKNFYAKKFDLIDIYKISFLDKVKIFIKSFFEHPFCVFVWLCFYFAALIVGIFSNKNDVISGKWSTVNSTK